MPIARKLPLAIAGVAAIAAVLAGGVGYMVASRTITNEAKVQLSALAESKSETLGVYLRSIEDDIQSLRSSPVTLQALAAFDAGFARMGTDATDRLQGLYIEKNPNPIGQKDALDFAPDGSPYSQAHARFHPWFRTYLKQKGYYDIFLFDTDGQNVYTVFKELDFATNLVDGQWKDTDLGAVFSAAKANAATGKSAFVDFKPYAPSNNVPASFIAAPITDADGKFRGVIAFQMPIDRINNAMSSGLALGQSGEAMILGGDKLMRNQSRLTKDQTILAASHDAPAVDEALGGKSGVTEAATRVGQAGLIAYQPLEFNGVTWAILVEKSKAEALAALVPMMWTIFGATLILVVIGAFAGIAFARTIAVPVGRLTEVMGDLANGNDNVTVEGSGRQDEIGAMARAVEIFKENALERRRLEEQARKEAASRAERTAKIDALTGEFESAVSEMVRTVAAAATELQATAAVMTQNAQSANQLASNVAAAAEEQTVNAETASAGAGDLAKAITDIERNAADSALVVREAVTAAQSATQVIDSLADAARRIGEVVDLIKDIADQTNLLALNATIEAARAGEAGRGFAIVAQEVKSLANQTAGATDDIAAQIQGIERPMKDAVAAIESIDRIIAKLAQNAQAIEQSVAEQSATTGEIARNVAEVSKAAVSVAEDITRVSQASGETGAAASQVLSASADVARQSEALQAVVSKFLTGVKAA
jgi:methyl-accepting chemotaxis protein